MEGDQILTVGWSWINGFRRILAKIGQCSDNRKAKKA